MKYIKLFETFTEDQMSFTNSYIKKVEDCMLYLFDNYKYAEDKINAFEVQFTIK